MKHAHIVANDAAEHQRCFGSAFAQGLARHGWKTTYSRGWQPADLVVLWGVRAQDRIQKQRDHGGDIVILERGYVGDRFAWTSVSFGGRLNGRAEFRGPFSDGTRWERHFAHLMQPWQKRETGDVLIMGQVDGDMSLSGANIQVFYATAAQAFTEAGYPVRRRSHPLAKHGSIIPPLAADLALARAVVTFNSNSAVDAVLAGIPTIAVDRGSMAWDVTGHDLGVLPPTPDRTAWAHALAWKQWTKDEMASGACWDAVGREAVTA